jgi:hypothetical protein
MKRIQAGSDRLRCRALRRLSKPNEHSNDPQNRQFQQFLLDHRVGRVLPAGVYEVVTDEELIEGLSFPVYRRVATMILAPTQSSQPSIEMLTIDPHDLATAMMRDTLAAKSVSAAAKLA